ncbi:MAG: hypothetical protein ACI4FX_04055 [Agathobacter sp.]
MKKRVGILILAICVLVGNPGVQAASFNEEATYYYNDKGMTLTKEEYNQLMQYMDEDELIIFTEDEINYLLSDLDKNIIDQQQVYVMTTSQIVDGEAQIINEEFLSEKEMQDQLNLRNVSLEKGGVSTWSYDDRTASRTTSMKQLTMNMYDVQAQVYKVSLTCKWLTLPQTRSYDVIAFRPGTSFTPNSLGSSNMNGYQIYDGNTITYNYTSSNFKTSTSGVGLSVNLKNDVSKSLSVKLDVAFASGNDPFTVYGAYEHAVQDVTLAQSQKYSISSGGMGKVIAFNSSVADYYDNTQGLKVTGSLNDLLE